MKFFFSGWVVNGDNSTDCLLLAVLEADEGDTADIIILDGDV